MEPSHELVESAGITEVSNANIDPEDLSITSTLYFVFDLLQLLVFLFSVCNFDLFKDVVQKCFSREAKG